jgi:hypothetical protein
MNVYQVVSECYYRMGMAFSVHLVGYYDKSGFVCLYKYGSKGLADSMCLHLNGNQKAVAR